MFKTLGLFNTTRCPDETCYRPYCLFSHSARGSASGTSTPTPARRGDDAPATKRRKVDHVPDVKPAIEGSEGKAKVKAIADTRVPGAAKQASISNGSRVSQGGAGNTASGTKAAPAAKPAGPAPSAKATLTTGPAQPAAAGAASISAIAVGPGGAPILPRDPETLKKSPQPYSDRQKALTTLYTQFAKLYRPLGPNHPRLAAKHALAQEAEISKEMPALDSYKRTIHHAAVSVLRRPAPDSIRHPSVGTLRESRAKVEQAAKDALSRLSLESCSRYILPLSEYADWGYPDYTDPKLVNPPETQPDAAGTEQTCDRCQKLFVVSADNKEERAGECRFHFGKMLPKVMEGRKKWLYSCCDSERGEKGCQEGLHVFREKDNDEALARREPYKTVKAICKGADPATKGWLEVVAIDCEMIYTTAGLSLARATVVDEKGVVILDEIVRQKAGIIDVNARFSGLTEDQVDKALMNLDAVRTAVCMFVGPETIIVGHGLENDLRALRLLHDKVIDTAILLPHPKGKPFRRALRDLVREKLGYFIQGMISDKGHSSAEDAQATLDVLKWKVRDDATPIDRGLLRLDK